MTSVRQLHVLLYIKRTDGQSLETRKTQGPVVATLSHRDDYLDDLLALCVLIKLKMNTG